MNTPHALIIGAGIGGLSAAIRLAAAGWGVTLFESSAVAGGKAGRVVLDGLSIDTGPSVLTLPHVFDQLFACAGEQRTDHLTWLKPDPSFEYIWPDGARLLCHPELSRTMERVHESFGSRAKYDFEQFMHYTQGIWAAAAPKFVYGPPLSWSRLLQLGPLQWAGMARIDALRTMQHAIEKRIRSPHLRDVLMRYATYNGSDPRNAPATFNCIAHVELALGGYGVKGGIYALTEALVALAQRLGVQFHFDTRIEQIVVEGGSVAGVLANGEFFPSRHVVANTEAAFLNGPLLGRPLKRPAALSTSLWTAIYKAPVESQRAAHTVFFPPSYPDEFASMFDRQQVAEQPSVYVCDPCKTHGLAGWNDGQPLFTMVNTPAVQASKLPLQRSEWRHVRTYTANLLQQQGFIAGTPQPLWERTAEQLATRFPGSCGALYGEASASWRSAFSRPGTLVPGVSGLTLASGSGHPGGGLPLAALSGVQAADSLMKRTPESSSLFTPAFSSETGFPSLFNCKE